MLSSASMPVDSSNEAGFIASPFHALAQQSHVDEATMAQLLTAYTREDWNYMAEVTDMAQPASCEPSLTIDPSLLEVPLNFDDLNALLPSNTVDLTAQNDTSSSSVPSTPDNEYNTASSSMTSDMTSDMTVNSVTNTVADKINDTASETVSNAASDVVSETVSDTAVEVFLSTVCNPSSNMLSRTVPDSVFGTAINFIPNIAQQRFPNIEGCMPMPPYSQLPFCYPYYGQPYLPPQPVYTQSIYPPSAAPPFNQSLYATVPMHPMGYNPYAYMMPQYPAQMPPFMPPPLPRQQPRLNSAQPPKVFEFVNTNVPENFVANPNNHGRWHIDNEGNRHYLNAPAARRGSIKET